MAAPPAWGYPALLDDTFPTARLSGLRMPTLVLVGKEDLALEAARLTHQAMPGAQLSIMLKAGHLANLDQPAAFNCRVLDFLQGVQAHMV